MKLTRHLLIGLALLTGGCASLTIHIDQYLGEQNLGGDAQLAEAVGGAEYVRQAAQEYVDRLSIKPPKNNPFPKEQQEVKESIQRVVDDYSEENIDQIKKDLSGLSPVDKSGKKSIDYIVKQRQLAVALVRYGQLCVSTGQRIGIPAAALDSFWFWHQSGRQSVITGISLEATGAKIRNLAANVLDQQQYSGLASVLESINHGMVENCVIDGSKRDLATAMNNEWNEINHVQAFGIGKTDYVFVKDEVGNWGIKSITNDPSDVINAAFDGANAMVAVLGSVYGIPVPTSGSSSSTASSMATASASTSDTATADVAQLRNWQTSLKFSLKQALNASSTSKNDTVIAALKQYEAEIKSLPTYSQSSTAASAQQ